MSHTLFHITCKNGHLSESYIYIFKLHVQTNIKHFIVPRQPLHLCYEILAFYIIRAIEIWNLCDQGERGSKLL